MVMAEYVDAHLAAKIQLGSILAQFNMSTFLSLIVSYCKNYWVTVIEYSL